jgi:hypothetical protein
MPLNVCPNSILAPTFHMQSLVYYRILGMIMGPTICGACMSERVGHIPQLLHSKIMLLDSVSRL